MNQELFSQKIKAARVASGLSQEEAAQATNLSRLTYLTRETNPSSFRVTELISLYAALNEVGKELLESAIRELFFCSKSSV